MSANREKDFFGKKGGSIGMGATTGVVGLLIGIWSQSHAPNNLQAALSGGWCLKPGPYYALIALAAILVVYGVVNIARALKSQKQ
jgi:hypothetical protein